MSAARALFRRQVNDKQIVLAGVGDTGVLSAILSRVGQPENNRFKLTFDIGGLAKDARYSWASPQLGRHS